MKKIAICIPSYNESKNISNITKLVDESLCKLDKEYESVIINFMGNNAVKRINDELGIETTLYCLTRNRGSIFEPYLFYLSVDEVRDEDKISKIISEEFSEKFMEEILKPTKLY